MKFPICVKLTGVVYGQRQQNIKRYAGPGTCPYELVRDPYNPYDPNAIKVVLFGEIEFGFIPRPLAAQLAPLVDSGRHLVAEFHNRNEADGHETVGLTVKINEIDKGETNGKTNNQ